MKGLSAKARVTFGLVGLAISVVLLAAMLDLVPDRIAGVRDGRAALAEVLASSTSGWVEDRELNRATQTLRLAVERSPDLLSAAMRRVDGRIMVRAGEHREHWQAMSGTYSTDTQLRVPILAGEHRWGELELRFEPLMGTGASALLRHPLVLLTGFVAIACFFSFYFYLSKALAQLDPAKAVPGRVRSALDTMAEGLLVIDRGGRVVLANRAFAILVGSEPEKLIGVQPAELAFENTEKHEEGAARFPWIRALETGAEEYGIPMRLRDRTGRLRALMVNCSPVLGASGRPGGVLVSFDDVTELEARGEALREAKEEADQANRAKSEFLANMSHEIRTPMNAILGFTDVLRRGHDHDERESRKYLNTIHSSGTHLLELINDILDLSKVESGRLEVEQTQCQAHMVIHEVVRVLGVKAAEKGIGLDFRSEGPFPESVTSDPSRLRQIITNLVGNAIKFTERGGVAVRARIDTRGVEPMLEIDVRDDGIGIPADKLDTVFEAFAQADSSVTRRFGGTGLGLPISRRFAHAMGGDITVASVPGEGSTFTVRIPTGALDSVAMLSPEEVAAAEDEAAETVARSWTFKAARVLVVDDAPENRALLSVVLQPIGLELTEAENGQEALERCAEMSFDIILMDMQMPVMDGYTATRKLRERGIEAPIVALTAHAMKGYEQECQAAGCSDFVTKPIDIDTLMGTLAHWLPDHALPGGETAEQPGESKTAPPEPTLVAVASTTPIVSTLADDTRMHGVLKLFGERLEREVVRMQACCEVHDMATLADLAHWLKGSAGTVGFGDFTEPARDLEKQARAGDSSGAAATLAVVQAMTARVELPGKEPAGADAHGASVAASDAEACAPAPDDGPAAPATASTARPITSSLAGDPRMHRVLTMFGERLTQRLGQASSDDDLGALAEIGHWLKGSAGSVGFGDFTEPAAALEQRARAGDAEGAERALAALRELASRIELPAAPAMADGH
jgi:PAS domain S-box-containing protein